MHKMDFGRAYCKDILKGNPRKFILYFFQALYNLLQNLEFYTIFWDLFKWNRKWKRIMTPRAKLGPRPRNRQTTHDT
jgi:hypothetical protein